MPRRFQTSGGTVPTRRSVLVAAPGAGCESGARLGAGVTVVAGPGSGPAQAVAREAHPLLSAFAGSFLSRNTPASNATSSGATNSWNHTRS